MRNDMRTRAMRTLPIAAAALISTLGVTAPGIAQVLDCSFMSNPVFIAGSTRVTPLLAAIAKSLSAASPAITIVYQGQESCAGANYMNTSPAGSITGTGMIWDSSGTQGTCNLSAASGNRVNAAVSDVFATTCGYVPATGVKDFLGPIQTLSFAVPNTSTQSSISVEMAYMVFGFGANTTANTIPPWTDPSAMEIRTATSGTQLMISAALEQVGSGFSASKVRGVSNSSSGYVLTGLTSLASGGNAEKAIGFPRNGRH